MKRTKSMYLALLAVLLSPVAANAVPIVWTLADAVLDDGQTITGGFVYDRDTNTYSDISITNSGSTTYESTIFNQQVLRSGNWLGNKFDDGTPEIGDFTLSLNWNFDGQELTNLGGTVDLLTDSTAASVAFFFCTNADCGEGSVSGTIAARYVSGFLTTVQVPEPNTFALLAAGLFGLGFTRRRRAA